MRQLKITYPQLLLIKTLIIFPIIGIFAFIFFGSRNIEFLITKEIPFTNGSYITKTYNSIPFNNFWSCIIGIVQGISIVFLIYHIIY